MTNLTIGRDEHSTPTFFLPQPEDSETLTGDYVANTEYTLTVPAGKRRVLFTYPGGEVVYIGFGDTAIPDLTGMNTTASYFGEMNPVGRNVDPGVRFALDRYLKRK